MSLKNSTPPATPMDDTSHPSFDNTSHLPLYSPERDRDTGVMTSSKSPYTDTQIISIDVGQEHTRFRVHRSILKQSPELDAKSGLKLWGEKSVSLPDLDEETAHTLVHFLYTGCYDTLKPRDATTSSALSQYKLGTCVYCAATRYKLPSLAELAKETMTALQEDLTIFDVLVVAREHAFPGLPEDEAWFSAYLEDAIHAARTKDADLFTRPEFVDQIKGDLRYRQIVIKAIVNPCSHPSLPTSVNGAHKEAETPKEQTKPQSSLSPIVAITNLEALCSPVRNGEPVLDEITPTLEGHAAPEPYMDELGWEQSKTFQSQKSGAQHTASDNTTPRRGHARVDSFADIKDDADLVITASDKNPHVGRVSEAKTVETEDLVEMKGTSVSPAPTETKNAGGDSGVTSPVTNGVDAAGAEKKKSKKKKKNKKAATEAAAVETDAVPVN